MVDLTHQAVSMVIAPPPLYNEQGRPGFLERNIRIELMTEDWKSAVLPLN
jgi:hypothetical protein